MRHIGPILKLIARGWRMRENWSHTRPALSLWEWEGIDADWKEGKARTRDPDVADSRER